MCDLAECYIIRFEISNYDYVCYYDNEFNKNLSNFSYSEETYI